jgi:hypothetical protein
MVGPLSQGSKATEAAIAALGSTRFLRGLLALLPLVFLHYSGEATLICR